MKGAVIHGVLLAIMLIYGYRTWTRDKTKLPDMGDVALWDKSVSDISSVEYKDEHKRIVRVERRGTGADAYWWGSDTTIESKKQPKPAATGSGSAAGSGSAHAGSGSAAAGSGSGSAAPQEEEVEVSRKTKEFPIGDGGEDLVKKWAAGRALRNLGSLTDQQKSDYKLADSKVTVTVTAKDGTHTFLLGNAVYGTGDKYAIDEQTGKAYVLSHELLSALEIGQSSLQLTDARGFDLTKIDQVTIEAGGKSRTGARTTQTDDKGQTRKTWMDTETKKASQILANFIEGSNNNLKAAEYDPDLKVAEMTQVLKLTYKDDRGGALGTLTLYKREKPGTLPEGQDLDPANPPKGEIEYYIVTERSRGPALVRKDLAQRTEGELDDVFSGKPEPEPEVGSGSGSGSGAVHSINPHGNPFGAPHGGAPGLVPHGAPPPVPPSPAPATPAKPAPAKPATPPGAPAKKAS